VEEEATAAAPRRDSFFRLSLLLLLSSLVSLSLLCSREELEEEEAAASAPLLASAVLSWAEQIRDCYKALRFSLPALLFRAAAARGADLLAAQWASARGLSSGRGGAEPASGCARARATAERSPPVAPWGAGRDGGRAVGLPQKFLRAEK